MIPYVITCANTFIYDHLDDLNISPFGQVKTIEELEELIEKFLSFLYVTYMLYSEYDNNPEDVLSCTLFERFMNSLNCNLHKHSGLHARYFDVVHEDWFNIDLEHIFNRIYMDHHARDNDKSKL